MDNLTNAIDVTLNHPLRKIEDVNIKGKPLTEILDKHMQWRASDGAEGMMADLSYADLENVDLSLINLKSANLFKANLRGAKLVRANLRMANLSVANLDKAVFYATDLFAANLFSASLCEATIISTFLNAANLGKVNLCKATVLKSYLYGANLYGALCTSAIIKCNEFGSANLSAIKHKECIQNECEYISGKILTNNIIGYKKCDICRTDTDLVAIVTLEIPRGAIVFSINGNKCRTNRAKVIAIEGLNESISNININRAFSHFGLMSYYVGDEINIYNFNCEYNNECDKGIHFFLSKEEAINYNF